MTDTVELGKIVGTHGVRGEVRAENWLDAPLWKSLKSVFAGDDELELEAARPHKSFMLLKLRGVDDIDAALALRGRLLTVPRARIRLPAGQYLDSDLYGFSVFDERTHSVLGTLREVRESPASLLYVVEGEGRELLIPAVPAFDRGADLTARVLRVETIEGMTEL